jgi:hypothetical protein
VKVRSCLKNVEVFEIYSSRKYAQECTTNCEDLIITFRHLQPLHKWNNVKEEKSSLVLPGTPPSFH